MDPLQRSPILSRPDIDTDVDAAWEAKENPVGSQTNISTSETHMSYGTPWHPSASTTKEPGGYGKSHTPTWVAPAMSDLAEKIALAIKGNGETRPERKADMQPGVRTFNSPFLRR